MNHSLFYFTLSGFLVSPLFAGDYTWGNLTENGSQGTSNGYALAEPTNWVGGSTPTFDSQANLIFSGLGTGGVSTTIFGGFGTTTMNRITVSTAQTLRFNSGNSTFSFQGATPTIDVQNGTIRMEVKLSSGAAGITKTGAGSIFSNLQSASDGFTGPFTIAQGVVTSGNNYALGDQKTVNIRSGGSANMNGQYWGSSSIVDGSTVARAYTFNIAGTGTNGEGAITNGSRAVGVTTGLSGIRNLNLDANASVGGAGDYNIGLNGTINGNGHTLTKSGANTIYISGNASNISYQVNQGRLVGHNTDNAFGGAAGSVSVSGGATLASNGARSFANSLTFAAGAILENLTGNSVTWSGSTTLSGGQAVVTGVSSSANITMSGLVGGEGGITKQGSNTLTFSNSNTYTGNTLITSGQLRLGAAGSIADSSEIRISNGASLHVSDVSGGYVIDDDQKLSGGGTIIGNATIAGTHTPGFSPGIQSFSNNLTYSVGSTVIWDLIDNTLAGRGTNYDGINVTGDLAFSGATTISLDFSLLESTVDWSSSFWDSSYLGSAGWKIFDVGGEISGFENLTLGGSLLDGAEVGLTSIRSGASFSLFQGQDGIYLNYNAVPEPGAALLGGLGFMLLLRRRRAG